MAETGTDATLEGKRAEITAKLESLRVSPGVAELVKEADEAVRNFKGEVALLEDQLATIDRDVGARERHKRDEAAQQRQDRWAAQRKQLLAEEETRLQAIENAERATRTLVEAVDELLTTTTRMAKLAQQLSVNAKVPSALSSIELVSRTAGRIASVMSTIRGHRQRFGSLEWPGGATGLYPPERSWREAEETLVAKQLLQPLLEHGKAS
jgi:DNA repair exonuclease SbcCD ATPase subunit